MPADRPHREERTQPLPKAPAVQSGDWIDAALASQREDWANGIRIPIADRLIVWRSICSTPARAAELIYHDFILRRDSGESPSWDDVLRQFPQYEMQLRHFRDADEIVDAAIVHSAPMPAQLEDYELLEEVGRGGMGVVYRARERTLDRTVAIKQVLGSPRANVDAVQRCLREARAVSRLNHPNIVHIYRVSECQDGPFIALEFVEGPTLARRIGGTPLKPRLAATIGASVARAIQYAHDHRIVHCDLKPANILLAEPAECPVPKVTDFGAAKANLSEMRDGTQFLGTPSYMAPEQVDPRWGPVGERTDVYGIGALLYEALTGRPPFRADSVAETLRQVVETEPARPRLLNPAVPRDLETVCLKCLQKESRRRYRSAAAVVDDLERFLSGRPILARPVRPMTRIWMWCLRNPGIATLAASLLLAVTAGMAGIIVESRSAEAARKNAVASEVEAQQLLSELIEGSPVISGRGYRAVTPSIDSLLKTEAHCKSLLTKNPNEIAVRVALTKVYGGVALLYRQRRETEKSASTLRVARQLWESMEGDLSKTAEARAWLATTYFWAMEDDFPQRLESTQRAESIWLALGQEQPASLELMEKIWACRVRMIGILAARQIRDGCVVRLQKCRDELNRLLRERPADVVVRKQLGLTCFLLGEIYCVDASREQANALWRESYDHYRILSEALPNDLLNDISLAITCSRLVREQPSEPYYARAVSLLKKAQNRLKALMRENPQQGLLRDLLVEDYCCLALCHVRAAERDKAARTAEECLTIVFAPPGTEPDEPEFALARASKLLAIGQLLRQANQTDVAKRLLRESSTLLSQLAVYPPHELAFLHDLGEDLLTCAALANQLGEPSLSLEFAEKGRHTIEQWIGTAPYDPRREEMLVATWERIAKAHWSMGKRGQALAAFRQATAIQKKLFDQEPSNSWNRASLSKFYDRLVFYGVQEGDLRRAADAIAARTRLWPDVAEQLVKSAGDFDILAQRVTSRANGRLSAGDQAEHDGYVAQGRNVRRAAEAASRRARQNLRVQRAD